MRHGTAQATSMTELAMSRAWFVRTSRLPNDAWRNLLMWKSWVTITWRYFHIQCSVYINFWDMVSWRLSQAAFNLAVCLNQHDIIMDLATPNGRHDHTE